MIIWFIDTGDRPCIANSNIYSSGLYGELVMNIIIANTNFIKFTVRLKVYIIHP
jgi:hypothetical protein